MKKHTSEEAYYERMRNLAETKKFSVKESQVRNLGTLIDYKRTADGIAYGIIKEQHHYFIKKGGLRQDPNVADFAYIGGLSNITDFQYKSLSEAEKQRNMMFRTINEAVVSKLSNTGSKKRLHEDKAAEEIAAADEMAAGLDVALGDAMPAPEGGDAMPAPEGGDAMPAPELGDEDIPTEVPELGDEDVPTEVPELGDEDVPNGEEGQDDVSKEIEKSLGKLTNKLRKTELTDSQVKSYVNSFLSAFKDKFPDIEIEDRKEMANKITKVVPPEDIEDLGQNVEDTEDGNLSSALDNEEEIANEGKCSKCGTFGAFAESKGYDSPEALMECGEEEIANVISSYATAHDDGQNDGDTKVVAMFIKLMPQVLDILKNEYGHEEYADELEPEVNTLSESTDEDIMSQIKEGWGGALLGGAKALTGMAKNAVAAPIKGAWDAGKQAVQKVGQGLDNAKSNIQQAAAVASQAQDKRQGIQKANKYIGKIEAMAADLAKNIQAANAGAAKAGEQPINVQSLMMRLIGQVKGGNQANLSRNKYGQQPTQEGIDPAGIEVKPLEEINVPELKVGQKLTTNAPVKSIKEDDEHEDNEIDVTDSAGEENIDFAPAGQSLGGGVMKPNGSGVQIKIEPDKSINIAMNESEIKIRKYVRKRLEEHTGLRKGGLNENKKSENLKKLDSMIDKQFKLYETAVKRRIKKQ